MTRFRNSVPLGSGILKAVINLDMLESQDIPPETGLRMIGEGRAEYEPRVLTALGSAFENKECVEEIRELSIPELRSGMVLLDPVEGTDGRLLVAHGQEVSVGLLERLKNFSKNMGVKEPLRVAVIAAEHTVESAASDSHEC